MDQLACQTAPIISHLIRFLYSVAEASQSEAGVAVWLRGDVGPLKSHDVFPTLPHVSIRSDGACDLDGAHTPCLTQNLGYLLEQSFSQFIRVY